MQDFLHIPNNKENTRIFYATGTAGWEVWSKPSGAKFISIFCLGGGAGGSAGFSNTVNTSTCGGGGGGASSGYTKAIYPASLLPDILYIQVGAGGAGSIAVAGGGGAVGGVGSNSFVSLAPSTAAVHLLAASNTNAPSGGGIPSVSAGGAAGTVPTVWAVGSSPFTSLGIVQPVVGLAGVAGSLTTGNGSAALNSNFISQSAGGAGKTTNTLAFAGGSINPAAVLLLSTVNGGTSGGGAADSGYGLFSPLCGVGGAGGGSTITAGGTGGRGGDGWYGSGGGGGGAGPTGGRGGKGGDGLVIITTVY